MTCVRMYMVVMRDDTTTYLRLMIYAFIIVLLLKRKKEHIFLQDIGRQLESTRAGLLPRIGFDSARMHP